MLQTRMIAVILLAVAAFHHASAQDAVPTEILQRTRLVKVGNSTGTAFSLDHKGKLYLITARHVAAALADDSPTLQLWDQDKWVDYRATRKLLPKSSSVDIAVLETSETIKQPFQIAVVSGDEGPTLGQQVWFLGFPFGDTAMTSRLGT